MKAYEFSSEITDGKIILPENVMNQLNTPKGSKIKVIILEEEHDQDEEDAFKTMAREEFIKGYDDEDAIYDNL